MTGMESFLMMPVLLYAEAHYRLFGLPSRYDMSEPEIVADVPFRVRTGQPLPVLLFVKDAHRYPVEIQRLTIRARFGDDRSLLLLAQDIHQTVQSPFFHRLFFCSPPKHTRGEIQVDVAIDYLCAGKPRRCFNDNYRLTGHKPFTVQLDEHPWPRLPGWKFGETHCHSLLSSDQVEFGPPIEALVSPARALELDYIAVTDHSYDLDDRLDDYLHNDPSLPKWQILQKTIARLNSSQHNVLFIAGEELSAGNSLGRNIHLLIYGDRRFYPGSGDGAEQWFRTKPELTLEQVLAQLDPQALAVAAHPQVKPPMLQRFLLRRGHWSEKDLLLPHLTAAQFWNGDKRAFLRRGLPQWIALLLRGRRFTCIAGNDAHGNFNRFRQIGTPHLSMREHDREVFGRARTAVWIDGEWTPQAVVDALRRGRAVCTDGPIAELEWHCGSELYRIGDTAPSQAGTLRIRLLSSPTFGAFKRAEVILGDCRTKKETQWRQKLPSGLCDCSLSFRLEKLPEIGYLRLEAVASIGGRDHHCFTNPIYLR